jgi:transcriptional regulator with XRE-family HTH domain
MSQGPAETSDEIFARRLRALRETAGLTQQQLADEMSAAGNRMHRSAVAKIESGDRTVSIGEAMQFAVALGIDLADLVTDRGTHAENEKIHRARVNARAQVQGLRYELAERTKVLQDDQLLLENTADRLKAAEKRLADLGGELPPETPQSIEASIPMQPLHPGKDDQ